MTTLVQVSTLHVELEHRQMASRGMAGAGHSLEIRGGGDPRSAPRRRIWFTDRVGDARPTQPLEAARGRNVGAVSEGRVARPS